MKIRGKDYTKINWAEARSLYRRNIQLFWIDEDNNPIKLPIAKDYQYKYNSNCSFLYAMRIFRRERVLNSLVYYYQKK